MSEGASTVRLSKAAREFNVGTGTIVEFLSKKGHQIDPNPNTKLSPEMYTMLVKEYQKEKQVKEVSQKLGIEYSGRKTITADEVVKNENIEDDEYEPDEVLFKNIQSNIIEKKAFVDQKPKAKAVESLPERQVEPVEEPKAAVKSEPVPVVEAAIEKVPESDPKPEPEAKPVSEAKEEVTAPPVEEGVKPEAVLPPVVDEPQKVETEKPLVEPAATVTKENKKEITYTPVVPSDGISAADGELKILGHIDLSTLNLKTKPDRKTKAQRKQEDDDRKAKEKLATKPKVAAKPAAAPTPAPVAPAVESKVPEEPTKPEAPEIKYDEENRPINFMRTEVRKLEGVKILDKIVLPEERKNKAKPVASSSEDKLSAAQKKKKRKRIKNKDQAPTTPSAAGQAPQGQGTAQGGQQQGQRPPYGQQNRPTGQASGAQRDPKKGKASQPPARRDEKVELTEEQIQKQIRETLARLTPQGKSKTSKHKRQKREAYTHNQAEEMARQEQEKSTLKVTEFVTANELATMMNVPVIKVISTCMSLGMAVSINQRLDAETLSLVAEEFGFNVEFISHELQDSLAHVEEIDLPEDQVERAPIVTVMGHVDHGKTLLLDYIRKSNVVAGEAGGITQHVGAYEVYGESGRKITFLDTPGHEAFTAMRARGAKVTDVAIIVIAADDSVMPQTKEAINHAQAAGVPIVFAFNKIDKPTANPEKIREQLANMNILVEDWGGKYQSQEVSAKSGIGIESLLEKVLLEAEILDLKGNPKKSARGTVLESSLDKGRGYVAKILIQDGSLKQGDIVLAGSVYGKVKAMFNERNASIKVAGPSTPTLLLGLNGAPQAGDTFVVMNDEKEVKNVAARRQQLQREQGLRTQKHITLDEIGRRIAIGDFKELNLIVKADVDGSSEALSDSLLQLSTNEVQVNVIHKSVGAITESDIMLASASNAIVLGFQVRPTLQARKLAEVEEIDIRLYSIIYTAIEEIKSAIEGMLSPVIEEVITCNIEIREVFRITKVGTIAGCMVLDGKVNRHTRIRVIRDGIVIHTGTLGSLKRFKDDVKEVSAGYECGLNIDGFNDIKIGDIIEGYAEKEVVRKL